MRSYCTKHNKYRCTDAGCKKTCYSCNGRGRKEDHAMGMMTGMLLLGVPMSMGGHTKTCYECDGTGKQYR